MRHRLLNRVNKIITLTVAIEQECFTGKFPFLNHIVLLTICPCVLPTFQYECGVDVSTRN